MWPGWLGSRRSTMYWQVVDADLSLFEFNCNLLAYKFIQTMHPVFFFSVQIWSAYLTWIHNDQFTDHLLVSLVNAATCILHCGDGFHSVTCHRHLPPLAAKSCQRVHWPASLHCFFGERLQNTINSLSYAVNLLQRFWKRKWWFVWGDEGLILYRFRAINYSCVRTDTSWPFHSK